MSKKWQAIMMLMEHPLGKRILAPITDIEEQWVNFDKLNYGVLSGGEKLFASWAFAIAEDKHPPETWRGCFDGMGTLDQDAQILITKALLLRWS